MRKLIGNLLVKQNKRRKSNYDAYNKPYTIKNVETLQYYLNIEKENMDRFLSYAYENGLKEKLESKSSELDIIQFLLGLSNQYHIQNEQDSK